MLFFIAPLSCHHRNELRKTKIHYDTVPCATSVLWRLSRWMATVASDAVPLESDAGVLGVAAVALDIDKCR